MTSSKHWDSQEVMARLAAERSVPPDAWQATRAQTSLATRFVNDKEDYLAPEQRDIGRVVGDNLRELFVSCDAAPAMLQQFDHLQPEFICVHDIGTASSRRLLAGIAAASGRAMQKLAIRRQGYGTTLATLEFVDFPGSDGRSLRLYTTEAGVDAAARQDLARVLLGYSRLGVVMVGEMSADVVAAAFKPLHDQIMRGPWPNRNLLLLPLGSAGAMATQATLLSRGTHLTVRSTPAVTRPADAWNFISGTWSRLRDELAAAGQNLPALGAAVARTPVAPAAPAAKLAPAAEPVGMMSLSSGSPIERYVEQVSRLNGMLSCCVFDIATGHAQASLGAAPAAAELARFGASLLSSMSTASRALGLGTAQPEAAITLGAHHLVLRALPRHPGLVLHAVLDKSLANVTLAKLQIERLDALLG